MDERKDMKLYAHQDDGLRIAKEKPRFLYAWDLGTGKSLLSLSIIDYFRLHRSIIVTRKNLIQSAFLQDYEKFGFGFIITSTCGLPKEERLAIYKDLNTHVVTSFETFRNDFEAIQKGGFRLLIVDESAAIKDPQAQVSKRMLAFAKAVDRAYLLSGLPAPNGPMEYWAQYQITAPEAFEKNWFSFRTRWFLPTKYIYIAGQKKPVQWELNPHKRKAFNERLAINSWFLKKEECVDLPEQIFTTRKVQPQPQTMKAYRELVAQWLTEVGDNVVVARNKLTELMKVRQLTAGFMLTDGGPVDLEEVPVKTQEVLNILKETEDHVIVACEFQHEVERLVRVLELEGYPACAFYGKTPPKERDQIVKDFQAGKYRVLVGHPRSFGPGLTLTRASTLIFHSLSYSYENYWQTCGRIHRIGQHQPCNYIFLVAENTIDEVMAGALQRKQDMAEAILGKLVRGKVKEAV